MLRTSWFHRLHVDPLDFFVVSVVVVGRSLAKRHTTDRFDSRIIRLSLSADADTGATSCRDRLD